MSSNQYQDADPPLPAEVDGVLAANDPDPLKRFVIGAALYWDDRNAIEALCSTLSRHPHEEVRGNAILGFGHIARRFGDLAKEFKEVIEAGLADESRYVRGQAWAAAEDVKHFLGWDVEMHPNGSP